MGQIFGRLRLFRQERWTLSEQNDQADKVMRGGCFITILDDDFSLPGRIFPGSTYIWPA